MRNSYTICLVVTAVLITVAVEEFRFSSMSKRDQVTKSTALTEPSSVAPAKIGEVAEAAIRTKSQVRPEATAAKTDTEPAKDSFAQTARKMWDNPAGKSMMSQGIKIAVAMQYDDFIDKLHLSKEESDYFKNLLAKEAADQQELGMKLLGATESERKDLAEEISKRGVDSQAEIKKFLNSGDDYQAFTDYKNHLPERQQLEGIRNMMATNGSPLAADAEDKLLDAMYQARTNTKGPDLSGPGAIETMMEGNITEVFEKSWDAQQETLRGSAGKILNREQLKAFEDYQKQAKEMQMMALKMAEKMMPKKTEKILEQPEKKLESN